MELLKGKPVSEILDKETVNISENLIENGVVPTLAVIRVGDNGSDIAYEESLIKKARTLGIQVEKFIFDSNASESVLLDVIKIINENDKIHGVLMFRPLPKSMDEDRVRNHLAAQKDIDCITDDSLARVFTASQTGFPPCTAEAAMTILDFYGIEPAGKKAVVIGRSLVIGKPVAMMLLNKNASVTVCHSKTKLEDLIDYCKDADIIVCATGKIDTLTADCVNGKQTVIDVGINFNSDGKMCGDVDFQGVEGKVAAITPVPGGVGGVTTSILMHHVAVAAQRETL